MLVKSMGVGPELSNAVNWPQLNRLHRRLVMWDPPASEKPYAFLAEMSLFFCCCCFLPKILKGGKCLIS